MGDEVVETVEYTLTNLLTDVGEFINAAVVWMSNMFTVFYENPIAMVTLFIFLTGATIGLCSRIFRLLQHACATLCGE